MQRSSHRLRRIAVLASAAAGIALVVRRTSRNASSGTAIVPVIGGDTWPPVPVKDTRPA
ncbi:MAG TPA: hypothetical protein VIH95_06775 [Acidimicrobiales bacterium]